MRQPIIVRKKQAGWHLEGNCKQINIGKWWLCFFGGLHVLSCSAGLMFASSPNAFLPEMFVVSSYTSQRTPVCPNTSVLHCTQDRHKKEEETESDMAKYHGNHGNSSCMCICQVCQRDNEDGVHECIYLQWNILWTYLKGRTTNFECLTHSLKYYSHFKTVLWQITTP